MKTNVVNRVLGVLLVLALLLSALPVLASSSTDTAGNLPVASEPGANDEQVKEVCQVTLITGDVVNVTVTRDGQRSFAISPAEPDRLGQQFLTIKQHGDTYIIPDGIDLRKLDMELFNIDYLVDEQYYEQPSLPLLVSYVPSLRVPEVQSLEGKIRALGEETKLYNEVSTIYTRLAYSSIATSYTSLMSQPEINKIWMDRKVHVQLKESVPLISAPQYWSAGYNGTGIKIAILDTGIDSSHPALNDLDDNPATNDPKVIVNINFTDDADSNDLFGHGTHVAGIAAGTNATSNYIGVAPGAWLWNVKVLNQYGWGYDSWIIDGINFASLGPDGMPKTGDEPDIINMSLGGGLGSDGTDPLSQAVNLAVDRNVVVVVAAGNSGSEGMFTINTPGVAEKALTVGASDKNDTLASFSSRGPTVAMKIKPDILAPGVGITSSVPTNPNCYFNDPSGYMSLSGTSMATPHVAGAAALLLEKTKPSLPPTLTRTQYVKNYFMRTAKGVGYSVYGQGAGRLDLTLAPWPYIDVSTSSRILGGMFYGGTSVSANLTIRNWDTISHTVSLVAQLYECPTGDNYSATNYVVLGATSCYILPSGNATVTLTINLANLPASLYSGRVIATVDGGGRTVHSIFGFAKVRQVTVHKVDIDGKPAQGDPIWALMNTPFPGLLQYKETNESGNATFYALDGNYHLISVNAKPGSRQISIWTIAENVGVSSDKTVTLDERTTKIIDFNPNKAGLIPSSKMSRLYYKPDPYGYNWASQWYYPTSFITRVSPVLQFKAGFGYNCYPGADFNTYGPELVNTGEWINLLYSAENITDNRTFIADYTKLVHRNITYGAALKGEKAWWYQFSYDDISRWSMGFTYIMDVPQQRWEWLSPSPVSYDEYYLRHAWHPEGRWLFYNGWSLAPGEYTRYLGYHPFTSGVTTYVYAGTPNNRLDISGPISIDAYQNYYQMLQEYQEYQSSELRPPPGHIRVTRDSTVVLEKDIWDSFWKSVYFSGTPVFKVEVWGNTPLLLSSRSYTRLDFTANPAADYSPPQVKFQVPGINPLGVVPPGDVIVKVWVSETLAAPPGAPPGAPGGPALCYSLGDSETWNPPPAPPTNLGSGWFAFTLPQLQNTLVNIRVDAWDTSTNHIRRDTWRAFYVGGVQVSVKSPAAVIPSSNFTAAIAINQVQNLVSATYDVSFNSTVLRLDNVTSGNISGTTIPVGAWNPRETPGVYGIAQTIGLVSGSGYLAVLHFHVLGSENQSSNITLSNATLANNIPSPIPAAWIGTSVSIAKVRPGDAYQDGVINALDIAQVIKIIAGLASPTPGADANLDGNINALDITKIERLFVGLDPS